MSALMSTPPLRRAYRWDVQTVTQPTAEPVTLAQAKKHLRVDHDEEDSLIADLITMARQYIERSYCRALTETQFSLHVSGWPCSDRIQIPRAPLVSIDSVIYTDSSEAEQTVSTDVYTANAKIEPPELVLQFSRSWPSATLSPSTPVRVLFTAGYGVDPETVPKPIRQAVLLLIGHYYRYREDVQAGSVNRIPMGASSLLEDYRVRLWT